MKKKRMIESKETERKEIRRKKSPRINEKKGRKKRENIIGSRQKE